MSIIVDENGEEYVWDECPRCYGTGEEDDGFSPGRCLLCDGRGEVRAYLDAYDGDEEPTP